MRCVCSRCRKEFANSRKFEAHTCVVDFKNMSLEELKKYAMEGDKPGTKETK